MAQTSYSASICDDIIAKWMLEGGLGYIRLTSTLTHKLKHAHYMVTAHIFSVSPHTNTLPMAQVCVSTTTLRCFIYIDHGCYVLKEYQQIHGSVLWVPCKLILCTFTPYTWYI